MEKKPLGRSMSVQPSTLSKKSLQPQMSSPPVGISSRFKISSVNERELEDIPQEQGNKIKLAESTEFVESMITQNKEEAPIDNNEESPNTSAESDDVFIVEKAVEDNSEA